MINIKKEYFPTIDTHHSGEPYKMMRFYEKWLDDETKKFHDYKGNEQANYYVNPIILIFSRLKKNLATEKALHEQTKRQLEFYKSRIDLISSAIVRE